MTLSRRTSFLAGLLLAGGFLSLRGVPQTNETPLEAFLVEPYLQLGSQPKVGSTGTLALLWHTEDADAGWRVELKPVGASQWSDAGRITVRRIAMGGVEPHRVYRCSLNKLQPGEEFDYRVLRDGREVFQARARAPKPADQPYRFAVLGDSGAGTLSQSAVALRIYRASPDFVFTTGDIVYSSGRISEYRKKFFPVYNAGEASVSTGAPLMRSTLFIAAPGNHDFNGRNLGRFSDGLAYFFYWDQPLNGPLHQPGEPNAPALEGPPENQAAFLKAAGPAFPRMANFSFDYGNSHWVVLDSNRDVDWTDPQLRNWLAKDLAAARNARWRFVAFHHPPFHSSHAHANDQWMRVLAGVFEAGGVDIVFAGHVHNYERSVPLRFAPQPGEDGALVAHNGRVGGVFQLDRKYDGETRTKPNGVIYLVTGAGGARLYDSEQQYNWSSWQEFTTQFFSTQHSFMQVDADDRQLIVAQVAEDGGVLDRFVVTK
jgi:3',5'-cyclic AMP phosphodiesterase CpdA